MLHNCSSRVPSLFFNQKALALRTDFGLGIGWEVGSLSNGGSNQSPAYQVQHFFLTGPSSRTLGGNTLSSCRIFFIYKIPIGRPFCSVLAQLPVTGTRSTFRWQLRTPRNFAAPCSRYYFLKQGACFHGCASCFHNWPWSRILRGDSEGSMPLWFTHLSRSWSLLHPFIFVSTTQFLTGAYSLNSWEFSSLISGSDINSGFQSISQPNEQNRLNQYMNTCFESRISGRCQHMIKTYVFLFMLWIHEASFPHMFFI